MSALSVAQSAPNPRQSWNTPANVLERVRAFDAIALDPCSNETSIVGAAVEWRLERGEDGLAQAWEGVGLVFWNPPFDDIEAWSKKASGSLAESIGLVPARVDTRWWHDYIADADAVCFWKGRLRFLGAPSSAPFPVALVYRGPRKYRFADVFSAAGWVVLG